MGNEYIFRRAYLWCDGERPERWVQVEGHRLSTVAVGWNQLLRSHSLELREEAHGGIIAVRHLDALRVEAPSVVWNVTRVHEASCAREIHILTNFTRTFINIPHVSEAGVELCRRSVILVLVWEDPI